MLSNLVTWTERVFSPLGWIGLFILAFIESSFFPIPPDLLLAVLVFAEPSKWWFFALVCAIGSVTGGMFGYLIGYTGKEAVLKRFVSEEKIRKVHDLFNRYESWAIFIAGFTPIPYKVFTIAGGVFYIKFWNFVLMSFISRGLRFFIVAGFVMYFGQRFMDYLDRFDLWTLVVVVLLLIIWWFYRKYKKKKSLVH